DVLRLRAAHPQAAVMCYVNSNADVKAVSDICCTSANALRIAKSLPQQEIIFVPDQGLGGYIARALPEKRFILAQGYCPTHWRITAQEIDAFRAAHSQAQVLIHPECNSDVLALADFVGSTSQIIKKAQQSPAEEFLIVTEAGVLHQMSKLCPQKRFFSLDGDRAFCPDMKKTQLDDVLAALEHLQYATTVDEELARKALPGLERMFAASV
ncbi:MAG TPA: quinolinate synthase, partial [Firmicutes bacterium]|nr:quinolinate synthase [Bacillota bacterium]